MLKIDTDELFFNFFASPDVKIIYKTPEESIGIRYLLLNIISNLKVVGLETNELSIVDQNWELVDDYVGSNNKIVLVFEIWANENPFISLPGSVDFIYKGSKIEILLDIFIKHLQKAVSLTDSTKVFFIDKLNETKILNKYVDLFTEKTKNRDKSLLLNQKGIEFKRIGDFDTAMDYYQQAKRADPTNKSCYLNIYKIDLGRGNNTLSNIQIFKHLDLLESTDETIEIAKLTHWESEYLYNGPIIFDNQIPNDFVFEFVQRSPTMILIAYDINTCFNYGFNILSSNQHFVDFHNIPKEYMDNYRKILLGIALPRDGNDLRTSKFENMVNILGFAFLVNHLKFDRQYRVEEIPELYKV